ncbi:MAG: SBBP repeat-containing protein [Candidatus Aminicenantes bacterium]|nr:SBBP repeat-containing protein [Candidatus Aminicenantes bacterium]
MNKKGMRFLLPIVCAALFAGAVGSGQAPAPEPAGTVPTTPSLAPADVTAATPLYFIANEGQMGAEALYCARTPGYTLWLTGEGLVFDRVAESDQGKMIRSRSSLVFLGANGDVEVAATDPSDHVVSYFFGRDEADWKTGVSTSRAVVYKNVYDGIDLKVYGTERQIEYDWVVAPGADPGRIRFRVEGGDGDAALNAGGDLAVGTASGRIVQRRPVAHQVVEGRRVEVASAFRAAGDGAFGFALGAYDPRRELTIDPLVLAASTYLGGQSTEWSVKVATDPTGSVYLTGSTSSGDFPPKKSGPPARITSSRSSRPTVRD